VVDSKLYIEFMMPRLLRIEALSEAKKIEVKNPTSHYNRGRATVFFG